MDTDYPAYEPCPCGSGKKYKFCCKEAISFIKRAEHSKVFNEREALDIIRAGRKEYPDNYALICTEVELLRDLERFDKAESLALEGMKKYPDAAKIHRLFGEILIDRENYESAVKALEVAYRKFTASERDDKFETGDSIIYCHVRLQNWEAVLDTAEELLTISKNFPDYTLDNIAHLIERPAPDDIIDRAKHFLMVNFPEFLLSVVDPEHDAAYDEDDDEWDDDSGIEDWDDDDLDDDDLDDEDLDDEEWDALDMVHEIIPGVELRRDGLYINDVQSPELPPEVRASLLDEHRKLLQQAFVSGDSQSLMVSSMIIAALDPTDWDATEALTEIMAESGMLDAATIALANHILSTFRKEEEFTEHCAIIAGELMHVQYLMYAQRKNFDAGGELIIPPNASRVSDADDGYNWKMVRDYFENHWIDELFPVIGKHTPREMSKIEEGREILNRCIDCFLDTLREDETTLLLWEPAKLKKKLGIG